MRLARPQLRESALLWFGLLGAPAAWSVQHVVGYGLTEATCQEAGQAGLNAHLDAWTAVVTGAALAVAVGALAAAAVTYRRTRDAGSEPPGSRIHFLSIVALTVAPLCICIMLMSGLGTLFLVACRQS